MKQSEVNKLCHEAASYLKKFNWVLPPQPEWAATDFGLGDYNKAGLVEILLCNEDEYCEKIMYAREGMVTPAHTHNDKREDIICRQGTLKITLWNGHPNDASTKGKKVEIKINRKMVERESGVPFELKAGERIKMTPGIFHEFEPVGGPALIGEVSTFCNEEIDNIFADPAVDIFKAPDADEPVSMPA